MQNQLRRFDDKSSSSSRILSSSLRRILVELNNKKHRNSTLNNYHSIWRNFNQFLIQLDVRPSTWEERVALYGAYLVKKGIKSTTIKSYFSVIKSVLVTDGYPWTDQKMLLNTLVKSSRIINDRVVTRLPIQIGLLELLIFELERILQHQPYLKLLYSTIFCIAYYGMFRIGELTKSSYDDHVVKASNVHIGSNKNKMLFVLYTLKTHDLGMRPQKIKITSKYLDFIQCNSHRRFFCPFTMSRNFFLSHGEYDMESEPFFIFQDTTPVKPAHV